MGDSHRGDPRSLREEARPLPAALRRRLRDIPRHEVACGNVDRLYRVARAKARGEAKGDPAAHRHVEACRRCATVFGVLAEGLTCERLPVPERLAGRLRLLADRPSRLLSPWLRDGRWAAAACYLLAAALTLVAGDASAAAWRDTAGAVGTHAAAWVETGGAQGRRLWQDLLGEATRYSDHLNGYGEWYDRVTDDAVGWWRDNELLTQLRNHDLGDKDGIDDPSAEPSRD